MRIVVAGLLPWLELSIWKLSINQAQLLNSKILRATEGNSDLISAPPINSRCSEGTMYSDIVIYYSMASFLYLEFVLRELTVGGCSQLNAWSWQALCVNCQLGLSTQLS